MRKILDWNSWEPKLDFEVRDWVNNNLWRLIQHMDIDDDITIEEKEVILIEYFTKYPDQIPVLNLEFPQGDRLSMIPKVQNIGGNIKYR